MKYDDEIIRRENKEGRGNGQLKHKAKFHGFDGLVCSVCGQLFGCQPDSETDELLCVSCAEARRNQKSDEYD
jgi:hypothetical protein